MESHRAYQSHSGLIYTRSNWPTQNKVNNHFREIFGSFCLDNFVFLVFCLFWFYVCVWGGVFLAFPIVLFLFVFKIEGTHEVEWEGMWEGS